MIVVVDDELPLMQLLVRALKRDGLEATGYNSPAAALAAVDGFAPALIVSDVKMPDMDGHEFRAAYARQHPDRGTPFVFLSALADTDSVLRGLEGGADDYLTKPIDPPVFVARIKAILRRVATAGPAVFRGSLGQMSFVQLFQFCERRGLTGQVRVRTPDGQVALAFEAGDVVLDGAASDEALGQLMDSDEGEFSVVSRPIGFDELGVSEREPPTLRARREEPNPMGLLSGVRLGERLVQVQTEYERAPVSSVVTTIVHEGRVLTKRQTPPPAGASDADLAKLIEEQHADMEQQIRERFERMASRRSPPAVEPQLSKEQFLEQGLQKYRAGDLEGALVLLNRAVAAYPEDRLLQANLNIVSGKLNSR